MNKEDLARLVTETANSLVSEGEVLDLGNDYRVSYVKLWFKDGHGHEAWGELFHANRHGDDREGKHRGATVEEAAEAVIALLRRKRDWTGMAREHNLHAIYVVVQRVLAEAKRYLYNVGGQVDAPTPEDPLIVF